MKLIGSLTESAIRAELVASNAHLRMGQHLASALLQERGVSPDTAYILEWFPEQREDLFTVLIGQTEVLRIEVDRAERVATLLEGTPLRDYKPKGRPAQLKLAVALDLVQAASR